MKKYVILLLFLLLVFVVVAHQPRITDSEDIIVKEPEISKAYYGNLEGNPHIYVINSDKNFNLYVNILVPNIEDIDKSAVREAVMDFFMRDLLLIGKYLNYSQILTSQK